MTADMKDLLGLFQRHGVEYVLVGGFAVNYYGYVRTTQDIDLLVFPSADNAQRVMIALSEFGFGDAGIPQELFEREGAAVHLGIEPNRIDILTNLKGVCNSMIFAGSQIVDVDEVPVRIISLEHLVEVKRSSDRPRDLADADELVKINT
ncbi:MAG: nucleotidyltransferase [Thermoanaerobaculales bacterium]